MKSITDDNKKTLFHNSKYSALLNDVEFELITDSDEFYYGIKDLFLNDRKLPIDFISNQELPDIDGLSEFLYYQVPKEYRDKDIVPSSLTVDIYNGSELPSATLIDDGNGNLIYDENIVGNLFYNSGVIILHDDIEIESDNLFDDIWDIDISFKYNVQFLEEVIEISVNENDFETSSNDTYDSNKPLFFSKIYLLNDNNQIIATATLSRPKKLHGKTHMILDQVFRY